MQSLGLTAERAVDACGGSYSAPEKASGYARGHQDALESAMTAVRAADSMTSGILGALIDLLDHDEQDAGCLPTDAHRDAQKVAKDWINHATGLVK